MCFCRAFEVCAGTSHKEWEEESWWRWYCGTQTQTHTHFFSKRVVFATTRTRTHTHTYTHKHTHAYTHSHTRICPTSVLVFNLNVESPMHQHWCCLTAEANLVLARKALGAAMVGWSDANTRPVMEVYYFILCDICWFWDTLSCSNNLVAVVVIDYETVSKRISPVGLSSTCMHTEMSTTSII